MAPRVRSHLCVQNTPFVCHTLPSQWAATVTTLWQSDTDLSWTRTKQRRRRSPPPTATWFQTQKIKPSTLKRNCRVLRLLGQSHACCKGLGASVLKEKHKPCPSSSLQIPCLTPKAWMQVPKEEPLISSLENWSFHGRMWNKCRLGLDFLNPSTREAESSQPGL